MKIPGLVLLVDSLLTARFAKFARYSNAKFLQGKYRKTYVFQPKAKKQIHFDKEARKAGTRRADAALCRQLRRLPNGKKNGLWHVFGKIKCLLFHRFRERVGEERNLRGSGKGGKIDANRAAARTMASTATTIVIGAILVGTINGASTCIGTLMRLFSAIPATGFFCGHGFFRLGIGTASAHYPRRQGDEAQKQRKQYAKTDVHKNRVQRYNKFLGSGFEVFGQFFIKYLKND